MTARHAPSAAHLRRIGARDLGTRCEEKPNRDYHGRHCRGERRCPRMDRRAAAPIIEASRALVLHDRPLVVDLITLTLNHGVFAVRAASTLAEAEAILEAWAPNISVVDMDHDDATAVLKLLGASNTLKRSVM